MAYILKNLHFIFIHVPIAMLIFSFVFDVLARLVRKTEWHWAGLLCLVVGTLGAIAAVLTGPDDRNSLRQTHETFGELTMIAAIVLSVIRLYFVIWKKKEIGGHPVYLLGALIAVALVTYTGHLGGKMVHRDGPQPGSFQPGPGNRNGGQPGAPGDGSRGASSSPSASPAAK
jgi:uncharacterized membrane protein